VAKAKLKIRGGNLDELEAERNEAEHKRVMFVEAFFVVLFVALSDLAEFFLPVLSWTITIPVSGFIVLWAFLRRLHGRFEIKWALGKIGDYITSGIFPIGTLVVVVLIWLNNRLSKKQIEKIDNIFHGHL